MFRRAAVVLLVLVGCTNPTHVLLESADSGNSGGSPPIPDAAAGPDAHEGGCLETDACPPPPRPCVGDRDCGPHSVCVAGKCAGCGAMSNSCDVQCAAGWESIPVNRNGCPACVCVPPRGCAADTDCGPGEVCYAGMACPPDCPPGSVSCCRGNICSAPGCADTRMVVCSLVGCPYGLTCQDTCAAPLCRCDTASRRWLCDPGCGPSVCR
jgi:hypothetical protein